MVTTENPFTPGFGSSPPILAGRDDLAALLGEALDSHAGHPARASLYLGARGTGKTVMLNVAEDQARQRGWQVISEDASGGLIERLLRTDIPQALEHVAPAADQHHLQALTTPIGGIEWRTTEGSYGFTHNIRTMLTLLVDQCEQHGTGVMITVDELHARTVRLDELDEFGNVAQHLIREGRALAVAVAGLPAPTHDRLLADDARRPITFFRRADRHHLDEVSLTATEEALRIPIVERGRDIDDNALLEAATATSGYPFMIQLVGFHIWRQAGTSTQIDLDTARRGIDAAAHRIGQLVHGPALSDVSDVDRQFLIAMAYDDGHSKIADIASRLGVDGNYANKYRSRLLRADMIVGAGRGRVDFTLPYFREYLRTTELALDRP